ncbi:MAG: DUF4019 domain-containing protein [Candidatus Hydrogenedentes bacterium]|nr:DUF4019 domain-containing protein [Candidatus Hydrogenedentota bacterium]
MTEAISSSERQPVPPPIPRRELYLGAPGSIACMGCGIVILLTACLFVVIMFVVNKTAATVEPEVDAFLSLIDQGKYDEAYASASPKLRQVADSKDFNAMCRILDQALGSFESKSPRHVHTNWNSDGRKTRRVTYQAMYSKGTATLTLDLEFDEGVWKVTGVHWNSDLLAASMKCPHCGMQQRQFVMYCGSCGKPLFKEDNHAQGAATTP